MLDYDWRFIAMVVCGQHLLKGLLAGGGSQGMLVVEGLTYMKLQVGAASVFLRVVRVGVPYAWAGE